MFFVSATPGDWSLRGVGLWSDSPDWWIQKSLRPTDGQIDDLLGEIKDRVDRQGGAGDNTEPSVAEDLTEYLQDQGLGCAICTRKLTRFRR